jgi:hypothetical protein
MHQQLDLSGLDGFTVTVEWVRNHVVLKGAGEKQPAMRLDVRLPENQQVALFMDTRDHYVLGFRGRDSV